jgi:6-phosphogluconolactonase (cycloisomerase 2 family)
VTNPLFFHPSGKYVYALGYPPTTEQGSSIYAYSIANNGQLVPLSGSPYPLPGAEVIAPELTMAMDPGGNFIVVSNPSYNQSNANWVYLIQPDGTLQPRANSPSKTIPAIDCFVGNPE